MQLTLKKSIHATVTSVKADKIHDYRCYCTNFGGHMQHMGCKLQMWNLQNCLFDALLCMIVFIGMVEIKSLLIL